MVPASFILVHHIFLDEHIAKWRGDELRTQALDKA